MANELTLTTRGLPTPDGPTRVDRTFTWIFTGDTLTIPKYQCGQTDFCPRDFEQHAWIAAHTTKLLHGVWDCVWQWSTPDARDEFMALLAPLDPLGDELARALRTLGTPGAAGRAKAAKTLLALDRANLAAAVPALERLLRDTNPGLRALATELLYRWHRRADPTRLSTLFRDADPTVRTAALSQAQLDHQRDPCASDRLPLVLERVADADATVRHQALQVLEVAANKGRISARRVLELRAEHGPLVDADGVDRSDALARIADRGPRSPSAPAMHAFYAALCAVELLRAQPDAGAGLARATASARTLWDRLPRDAPEEVRLYDTRIDVLTHAGSSVRPPDPDLARRIVDTRSPRRELDAAAIYWVLQHTAPKGLPAELVRREAERAREAEEHGHEDENMRSFLRHLD